MDIFLSFLIALSYGVESIFGFGGTIIFMGVAAPFYDIKLLLVLAIYVGIFVSASILCLSYRFLDVKTFIRLMIYAVPGFVLGTYLSSMIEGHILLRFFAGLLIVYGVQGLFLSSYKPPRYAYSFFVMAGGLMQGLVSTGGSFIVMGSQHYFVHKTTMRATLALVFLCSHLIRLGQFYYLGVPIQAIALDNAYLIPYGIGGVLLGHFVHVRLPEKIFQRLITIFLLLIGFWLLVKS